jgi:hypothetical protein
MAAAADALFSRFEVSVPTLRHRKIFTGAVTLLSE